MHAVGTQTGIDPDHDDAKITAMVEHARMLAGKLGSAIQIEAAREGQVVKLAPKV